MHLLASINETYGKATKANDTEQGLKFRKTNSTPLLIHKMQGSAKIRKSEQNMDRQHQQLETP